MPHLRVAVLISLLLAAATSAPAQSLVVRRVDGSSRTVTAEELRGIPRTAVETLDHGKPARFEGVDLRGILTLAGAGPVDSLRGPLLRRVVLLVGADGYAAAVALAELDESLAARKVYVVDRANDGSLPEGHGPLRAIVTGDGRAGRWVRQLSRVEVIDVAASGR